MHYSLKFSEKGVYNYIFMKKYVVELEARFYVSEKFDQKESLPMSCLSLKSYKFQG